MIPAAAGPRSEPTPEQRLATLELSFGALRLQNQSLQEALERERAERAAAEEPRPARVEPLGRRGLDTRALGKPEVFEGQDAQWSDWAVVTKAYAALMSDELRQLIAYVENASGETSLRRMHFTPDRAEAASHLY